MIGSVMYCINKDKCSKYSGDYQKVSYNNLNLKKMIGSENEYIIIKDYQLTIKY